MIKPCWTPPTQKDDSNFSKYFSFLKHTGKHFNHDYEKLHQWSIREPNEFWLSLWDYFSIDSIRPNQAVSLNTHFKDCVWFGGAQINYARQLLSQKYRNKNPSLIHVSMDGKVTTCSPFELERDVKLLANFLQKQGLRPGDRVIAHMPNCIETVVAMLATVKLGGVWTCLPRDFGIHLLRQRTADFNPDFALLWEMDEFGQQILSQSKKLKCVITCRSNAVKRIVSNFPIHQWDACLIAGQSATPAEYYSASFMHPATVLFTSGTQGKSKAVTHGFGALLNHYKELHLHVDLRPGDVILFITGTGWMMWNWMISAIGLGATVVLADFNPFLPKGSLLQWAQDLKVNVLGLTPAHIHSMERMKLEIKKYDLSLLRTVLSTGAPLAPAAFDFFYENFPPHIRLSSISGGTEINGCFGIGNPLLPVYPGEIQCKGLGMAVEFWDENREISDNRVGELVCTSPFPSAPLSLLNDPAGEEYLQNYFYLSPRVWSHGDRGFITQNNGIVILGRSDSTMKPGGVRINASEIYSAVEGQFGITDSIATGFHSETEELVVLFLVLEKNNLLSAELETAIRLCISQNLSRWHVPRFIFQVDEIPYNYSLKKAEACVRALLNGWSIQPFITSIRNPKSLEQYSKIQKTINPSW